MKDQLWNYLDRTDRENARLARFIYSVNIVMNLLAFLTCVSAHIKTGFIAQLNDIHAVMAVMYMAINLQLLIQIKRHRDERRRMYLLNVYAILIGLDTIAEQFILAAIHPGPFIVAFFGRSNVLFLVTASFTMAIYINRYISLRRKYSMLFGGKEVT